MKVSEPKWQHADPCSCWTDSTYGPIIGASCAQVMGADALETLKTQKPQTADPVTSVTVDYASGRAAARTSLSGRRVTSPDFG